MNTISVLAFAGSLRERSLHKGLIETSKSLAPEGMEIIAHDLAPLPLYNMDLESEWPEAALSFKSAIASADGVLIACPEHNYSYSGVLKNAIDWASRPKAETPFRNKPVILQSASTGMMGGSRAQYHLRQVLGYLECRQMQFPEVFIPNAADKFDENVRLIDERGIAQIKKQLEAFQQFIGRG